MIEPRSVGRWRRVEKLLASALDMAPGQRAAFLDTSCGGDAGLRAEVEALLHACEHVDDFLAEPAAEFAAPMLSSLEDAAPAAVGDRIGAYRIIAGVGRGGMAVVYLAERDDGQFRKRVALKLVRSGLTLGDELPARFREERQILASLEHPGLAEGARFSVTGLRSHRAKLGLSAADYGLLAGLSAQTIYSYERGESKPRPSQLAKLVAVRSLGQREAERRLALLKR